jgi:FkbH-like protein
MNSTMETDLLQAIESLKEETSYRNYSALHNLLAATAESDLESIKVAVLRNFTVEPVLPVIIGELGISGFHPDPYIGDYDAIAADVFNSGSALYQHNPDVIIIAQWLESVSSALSTGFLSLSNDEKDAEIDRIVHTTIGIIRSIRLNSSASILINNFPLPELPTLGILDAQSEQFHINSIIKLNSELVNASKEFVDVYWVNYLGLFARIGYSNAVDKRHWQMARAPLSKDILVPLGKEYGKFFRALKGKSKKCLVLDCDNTLWGGVIGEDGLSGIQLGTTYPGSSFKEFQQEILNLYHRGVILALCSKNNLNDVLEVLRKHPDMILKEHHFATWQINWDDKATNLKKIADDLNIGSDSLVFVDDSAFECDWVKEQMPEVSTLHIKSPATSYVTQFSQHGYFDSLTFSSEDKKRSEMYVNDKKRKEYSKQAGLLEDYLKSLHLAAEIGTPGDDLIPRVSQLTQKTNQFNLTTRRYTEGDIHNFLNSTSHDVYYMRLSDKVSDLGLIGVAIVNFAGEQAEIDTFLLSCRALGRGAEDALMHHILTQINNHGSKTVTGNYIETAKNSQVSDFYVKQGFRKVSDNSTSIFCFEIKESVLRPFPEWIVRKNSAMDLHQE